jgi:hypothetical protein
MLIGQFTEMSIKQVRYSVERDKKGKVTLSLIYYCIEFSPSSDLFAWLRQQPEAI